MIRGHRMLPVFPCALAGWVLTATPAPAAEAIKARSSPSSSPIAVVELFTSEVCPSCPAADAYLGELASNARRNRQAIYPLSFHVDYWSEPGQEDPLSNQQFAERQRGYVKSMNLDGAYTPQMIVNGTDEFIGTERDTGQKKIKTALARPARLAVQISVRRPADSAPSQPISVDYEVSSVPAESVINIALVEKSLSGKPKHSGKARLYVNVVREFRTIALKSSGKHGVQLTMPSAAQRGNCAVIAYVQNTRTRAILGAAATDLPSAPTGQVLMAPRD